MSIKKHFQFEINAEDYGDFKRSMVFQNLVRSRTLAIIVIVLELILSTVDIVTSLLKVSEDFHFSLYLVMYMIMITANLILLWFFKRVMTGSDKAIAEDVNSLAGKSISTIKRIEYGLMTYMIFMLSWGSVVTLLDQRLYGQAMTFIINLSVCSFIYYFEAQDMLAIYILPVLIFFVGLPFFQPSSNIVIGHYVNISIFIVLSFVASRISFSGFLANFKSNRMLEDINTELKELTLVDDLTQIPNRRNFSAYIDFKFKFPRKEDKLMSLIMIDIDCFKQYNDNYGHIAGDEVIIAVAHQIHSIVRRSQDFVARIGGDEFVFVSENTSEEGILKIAGRIIDSVASLKLPHAHSDISEYVTLSLGTATTRARSKEDVFKCLEDADRGLYETKARGRNGVTSYNSMTTK